MCCNPANGRVDFEDGWLIKSSFITKDEHEACQLTRTKVQQKKKKKKKKKKKGKVTSTFSTQLRLYLIQIMNNNDGRDIANDTATLLNSEKC